MFNQRQHFLFQNLMNLIIYAFKQTPVLLIRNFDCKRESCFMVFFHPGLMWMDVLMPSLNLWPESLALSSVFSTSNAP